ncbi:CLUMA_CG010836, isoform A [Clunio marinus]|uniref:Galactosylgalactosylxylosylprotein 3-beta-glucuronosyltransferase n=1 Tax=Clunio marinus TaxID=568069 RepID=A0A1J1IAY4_9DIPT|nr:CLUMA_CG010836, isoform A [Clunio marinus]
MRMQRYKKSELFMIFLMISTSVYILWTETSFKQSIVENFKKLRYIGNYSPPVYVITQTHRTPTQLPDLTRLGNTLKHVSNLFWIIVEETNKPTEAVTELLERMKFPYVYLTCKFSFLIYFKIQVFYSNDNVNNMNQLQVPAGNYQDENIRKISNRNRALEWLRSNAVDGVFFFADENRTFDPRLFEDIRSTKKISMFPVGLTSNGLSSPVVRDNKLIGFYSGWRPERKYPVDTSSFAINVNFFLSRPDASIPRNAHEQEDGFLKKLEPFGMDEIELLASSCTKILVWKTETVQCDKPKAIDLEKYKNTNLEKLANVAT